MPQKNTALQSLDSPPWLMGMWCCGSLALRKGLIVARGLHEDVQPISEIYVVYVRLAWHDVRDMNLIVFYIRVSCNVSIIWLTHVGNNHGWFHQHSSLQDIYTCELEAWKSKSNSTKTNCLMEISKSSRVRGYLFLDARYRTCSLMQHDISEKEPNDRMLENRKFTH